MRGDEVTARTTPSRGMSERRIGRWGEREGYGTLTVPPRPPLIVRPWTLTGNPSTIGHAPCDDRSAHLRHRHRRGRSRVQLAATSRALPAQRVSRHGAPARRDGGTAVRAHAAPRDAVALDQRAGGAHDDASEHGVGGRATPRAAKAGEEDARPRRCPSRGTDADAGGDRAPEARPRGGAGATRARPRGAGRRGSSPPPPRAPAARPAPGGRRPPGP